LKVFIVEHFNKKSNFKSSTTTTTRIPSSKTDDIMPARLFRNAVHVVQRVTTTTTSTARRCISTTRILHLDWMAQVEADAIAARRGRRYQAATAVNEVALGRLEHEFKAARVQNASSLSDRVRNLIAKCDAHRGNATLFNAIRKRALAARQELIAQREAAGLAKDGQANAAAVEATFPIPGPM
jgi:hypothetical protein